MKGAAARVELTINTVHIFRSRTSSALCRPALAHPDMQLQAAWEVKQLAGLQAVLHAYLLAPDELPARARLSAVHA